MPRSARETRDRILRAAEDVVIRDGVARLTLESAAQEAGVSKGGVLYHFNSRAALVAAMVEHFVLGFDALLEQYGAGSGRPGAFTRAYVLASFAPWETADGRERRLDAALLAGAASDLELLEPMRRRFASWQERVENDGLAPELASLIRLAADGLWTSELFELAPPEGPVRDAVREALLALVEKCAGR